MIIKFCKEKKNTIERKTSGPCKFSPFDIFCPDVDNNGHSQMNYLVIDNDENLSIFKFFF